jgi:ssDNA-binding Zn-finger/Zn-ribbon topoisomerase 1
MRKAVVRKVTKKGKTKFVAPKAVVKKHTKLGKSYWNRTGAYNKEYTKLEKQLVPDSGEANTVHGEMIRAIGRLFYDFCNNGNCNVLDVKDDYEQVTCNNCGGSGEVLEMDDENEVEVTCDDCGGSGEVEEDMGVTVEIDSYYQKMLDVLEDELGNCESLKKLNSFLMDTRKGYSRYTFDMNEMKIYNDVVDDVMYRVLTTKNRERIVIP